LITGFIDLSQKFAIDFFDGRGGPSAGAPVPIVRGFPRGGFTILNDGEHTQFSQEIKVNGQIGDGLIDYVVGAYYLDEDNSTDFADILSTFSAAVPGGNGYLLADRRLKNETSALAGYAQADVNLGPVTITAGIRYTDEEKTIDFRDNRPVASVVNGARFCLGAFAPAAGPCLDTANLVANNGALIPTKQSTKVWTPRFAANFKATDDILLFASATRGFKSGGWNARGTSVGTLLPFGPEKVWSYEAGIKSDLFDRRARINVTAFWMDVSNLQTPSALVGPTGAITFITRNFADYRNKGIEAELLFEPADGLIVFTNFGYQDDKYLVDRNAPAIDQFGIQSVAAQQLACRAQLAAGQVPGSTATTGVIPANNAPACAAGIVDARGNIATPVRTPKWTISMGASYKAELGGGLSLTPSINASFRSKQEVGTSNLSFYTGTISGPNGTFPSNPFSGQFITGSFSPSAWLINAGLALKSEAGFELSVDCTNCLDKEYIQSTLANYSYLNRPMEWTVRAKYRF
jgi:iron complex outermembrane recepter protein